MSSLNFLCQNEMTIAIRIPDEASTLPYKRWPFSIILSASNYRLCVSLRFPNNFTSNFFQMLYVPVLIVKYKKIVSNKEPSLLKKKEEKSVNRIVYFHSQVFSEKFPSASTSASSTTTKLLRDASLPFDDDL
jgi:hypothetical protein